MLWRRCLAIDSSGTEHVFTIQNLHSFTDVVANNYTQRYTVDATSMIYNPSDIGLYWLPGNQCIEGEQRNISVFDSKKNFDYNQLCFEISSRSEHVEGIGKITSSSQWAGNLQSKYALNYFSNANTTFGTVPNIDL